MSKTAESAVGFEDVVAAWTRGDPHATRESCARLLERRPRHVEALSLLGASSLMLGDAQKAEACFRKALANQPGHVPSNYMLANMLRESGDPRTARIHYRRALDGQPTLVEAWINLGLCMDDLGQPDEALDCCRKALALRPGDPLALYNLGNGLQQQGRWIDAINCYQQALLTSPQDIRLHFNLGNALLSSGQPEEAAESFGAALAIDPRHVGALANQGVALRRSWRLPEAIECLEQAVELEPQNAEALLTLGNALAEGGRADLAATKLERVVALQQNADAQFTLGTVLLELNRVEDALACFLQSRTLQPRQARNVAGVLAAEMMLWDSDAVAATSGELLDLLQTEPSGVPIGTILQLSDDPNVVRLCAESLSASVLQPESMSSLVGKEGYTRVGSSGDAGRIKVAYLSPDFGEHPVGLSIVEMLEKHNDKRVDVLGISLRRRPPSLVTSRIEAACTEFIDASMLSNRDLVQLIKDRAVDIAVDLVGHTYGSRSQVLAARPAPVQAGYLGFAHTLGAPWMDYLIVDRFVAPTSMDAAFSEALYRLPQCFFPTDSTVAIDWVNCTRAAEGLPESGFVFCCFNSAERISAEMMDTWLRTMRQVAGSVLWLRRSNDLSMARMRARATREGVDPQRLVFARHVALREEHLARHRLADLYLDTFPYNSHSTARDALFAGLPILTRCGRSFASRVAGSLVMALDLPELIVGNLVDYERQAVLLASDATKLADIRRRVNHAPQRAQLFDSSALASAMEYGFAVMQQRRLHGEQPRSFEYAG